MTTTSAAAAALAASCTAAPDAPARATALIHAARLLLPALEPDSRSMRRFFAPRWSMPSARPTPRVAGTGKRL
jgi:hypothetical protein